MRVHVRWILAVASLSLCLNAELSALTSSARKPPFTVTQAQQGKVLYDRYCLACHGENLNDGHSPLLKGDIFYSKWGGHSVNELLRSISTTMPVGSPGSLNEKEYLKILAYMFQATGFPATEEELPSDPAHLEKLSLPVPKGGLLKAEIVDIPPPPNHRPDPLEVISPVTDQMLADPPEGDWLMWRRTHDAQGFSPLKDVDRNTVRNLNVAWAWTMPAGRNIATPLVHAGVMFMYGTGSRLYAFDASTGDILWRYDRVKNWDMDRAFGPRAISIYEETIILTTDDGSVVALDIHTGETIWDKSVLTSRNTYFSGGSMIAAGRVILGTSTSVNAGDNFIIALDARTGEEAWRFYTIEQQEPGRIDTWNGATREERQGAGTWIPGSYDANTNLAFFGTGNTYRPQLLEKPANANSNNDALYTNSTLALDVDTGKLAWFFQHLPNDQWNYDWAFERTILPLPINDTMEMVVLTAGKQAIYEAMEVNSGKYLFSMETGFQNVVTAIDPQTGQKTIDPETLPAPNASRLACPDSLGARIWQPTSINSKTAVLFTPFRESCMKIRQPLLPGDTPHGHFGQKPLPIPDSDGNFGGIKAINLEKRTTLWEKRQRFEPSTGLLATAGGLLFYGSRDRVFYALDQSNGNELWKVRLNGVPVGGPISFRAAGKQYIAVTTGDSVGFGDYNFGVDDKNPRRDSPTIWVFGLRTTD